MHSKYLEAITQSIGYNKISLTPSKLLIIFHFGLGNDLDYQFLKKTKQYRNTLKNNPVIPGKSYCYLNFQSSGQAQNYAKQNFKQILKDLSPGFAQIHHQNLTRTMICFYCKETQIKILQQTIQIQDTPYNYVPQTIPGIHLLQNFITKQQQLQLLESIDKAEWSKLNNRRVQHYGYEFKYGRNQIDKQEQFQHPMPNFILKILDRLQKMQILPGYRFDQMTINDYFSGDGIPSHFDTHSPFQQYFVAISMLSGIVMDWRRFDGVQKQTYLLPRSLIIFSGQGRYAWTHGITCRKIDKIDGQLKHRSRRISITLRKIKFTPCQCPYYFYCDSQGYDQTTMKKNNPLLMKYLAQNINNKVLEHKSKQQIYQAYVIDAYKGFGFDFHNKAIKSIQNMLYEYLKSTKSQHQDQRIILENKRCQFNTILDVGCGNGEYKDLIQKINQNICAFYHYIGIEICQNMKPFQDKLLMDGLSLKFRDNSISLVLCIAVLHHMTSYQQRILMLKQIHKVLQHNGILLLTVFGYEQKSGIYKEQDILLQYCIPNSKVSSNTETSSMRKQKRGDVYSRYYHLFKQQQIKCLMNEAQFEIVKYKVDKQNIIIMARKAPKLQQVKSDVVQ